MFNRKLSLLFLLGLTCGLGAMDAPGDAKTKALIIFEGLLIDAVKKGNAQEVSRILNSDEGPDYIKEQGQKAFLYAIQKGNKGIVHLLLAYGDEQKLLDTKGVLPNGESCTPLSLAEKAKNPGIQNLITALMQQHRDPDFPQSYFSPGIASYLKKFIQDEQSGIWGALFRFTLYDVAQEMVEKKSKDSSFFIKLCVNKDFRNDHCEALRLLADNGAEIKEASQRYPYSKGYETMHHKFILFYGYQGKKPLVWTGSFNLTGTADENNWENVVVLDDTETIRKFIEQFKPAWDAGKSLSPSDFVYTGTRQKSAYSKKQNKIPSGIPRFLPPNTAKE